MKYPILVTLVFLSIGMCTETMNQKPKTQPNPQPKPQNQSKEFIPLSPKRRDSTEAKKPGTPMTAQEKSAFLAKNSKNT